MSIMSSRARHKYQRKGQGGRLGGLEAAAHWEGGESIESLFPCLCPNLGVEMHNRGSGLSLSLAPWLAEPVLQLSASDLLLRMALSTHKSTLLPRDATPHVPKPPRSKQLSWGRRCKAHGLSPCLGEPRCTGADSGTSNTSVRASPAPGIQGPDSLQRQPRTRSAPVNHTPSPASPFKTHQSPEGKREKKITCTQSN